VSEVTVVKRSPADDSSLAAWICASDECVDKSIAARKGGRCSGFALEGFEVAIVVDGSMSQSGLAFLL